MDTITASSEATVRRRAYPSWSVEIPVSLEETLVSEGGYWHAYDEHRSVSLTSVEVTDRGRPVPARSIVRTMGPMPGEPLDCLPPGLVGWAVTSAALQPARASRSLSGMLAVDGRALMVTITSDDADWTRGVWLSIRATVPRRR